MDVSIRVVEDDAANIGLYYPESSFDVVAYHHAINDIIQTIIADREGMDTVNQDWWTIEPLIFASGDGLSPQRYAKRCGVSGVYPNHRHKL